jgi:hypothetical protein
MPPANLASVLARLDRADEHVTALHAAVDAYVATPPWLHGKTLGDDGSTITERVDLMLQPPLEIAVTLSDVVHQLRAALDNLVGVLRPGGPTGTSAFPIHREATPWEAKADTELQGVPISVRDEIRSLQPFTAEPWHYIGDHLIGLHDLARRDRHRAPIISAALVRPDYAETSEEGGVKFFGNSATWAEIRYATTVIVRAHWAAEVRIAEPDIPEVNDREVTGLATALAREVRYVIVNRLMIGRS